MDFERLIQQPESLRDDRWEENFLSYFSKLNVQIESDQAKQGPDGWPYLYVRTTGESLTEPIVDVVRWLAGRGIGLAVNTHKMLPDYVFPYGMLWNFVETGRFLNPTPVVNKGDVVFSDKQKLIYGPPSDKFLPPYVRAVLLEFLRAQGFTQPRILVITAEEDYSNVDLVFSLQSLGNPSKSEHQKIADMLAWFLPLHYTLVLGDEKDLPQFYPLT